MQASVAQPLPPFALSGPKPTDRTIGKLTGSGVVLLLSGLAVVGSGIAQLRPSILGLHLHPYLLPVGIAFPFLLASRLQRFPPKLLFGLGVFAATYVFSTLSSNIASAETPKILTAIIVIVSSALLVLSRADFVAGVTGLSLAIGTLAVRGLSAEGDAAAGALDLANKNSYSLFALPSILLSFYVVLNFSAKKWVKAVLLLTSLASIITIFSSGNRSGYVGVLLVLLMLMIGRKFFGVVLAFSIAIVVFAALSFTQSDHIAQERIERTFDEKMTTDVKRIDLLLYSIQIGLENPIIGVSPVGLRYELALRLGAHRAIADPHNVFASVIGGSGLICFSALVYIGWALCTPRKAKNVPDDEVPNFYLARRLSRMLVVLWVVRGMFTREILYNPSFCLAIGMCIGLCLESGGYLRKAKTLARQLAYPPLAA